MNFKRFVALPMLLIFCLLNTSCTKVKQFLDVPIIEDEITFRRSAIALSDGTKIEVEEKETNGFRDRSYSYRFTTDGTLITTSSAETESLSVRTGQSQGIPYFFQDNIICILYKGKWIPWAKIRDGGSSEWWPYTMPKSGALNWPPYYKNRLIDFRIEKFTAQSNNWIITIYTGTNGRMGDWSEGMIPPYVRVISSDFGKTWKVKKCL